MKLWQLQVVCVALMAAVLWGPRLANRMVLAANAPGLVDTCDKSPVSEMMRELCKDIGL